MIHLGSKRMTWKVEKPNSIMVDMACSLFNATRASDLPDSMGAWGINNNVWQSLIDLTYRNCRALSIPVTPKGLQGMCIWASVVAAKFYVHKFAYINSRVIRVNDGGDHYFVSVRSHAVAGICDITCNQFGGPDFITGSLRDVKGPAQRVKNKGGASLYDAYVLGASTSTFVL